MSAPLPRSAPDPAYLLRLRERAFARMRQDEEAIAPPAAEPTVSRRWTLQRMALVAASLTPAAATLQAAAAGFRSPAPQYGAPGFYAEPPAPMPPDLTTHADLGRMDSWKSTQRLVVSAPNQTIWSTNAVTRTLSYQPPQGPELSLNAIVAESSALAYIMNGNAALYVADRNDLYGVRFETAELILIPSLFQMPLPANGIDGLIAKFATGMTDMELARAAAPKREIHIPLTKGVPEDFWKPRDGSSGRPFRPFLQTAGVQDGVLSFSCSGPSNRHYGTFNVDLRTRRLASFKGQ